MENQSKARSSLDGPFFVGKGCAGVYAIFYNKTCIYVGQSGDIRKRLITHDYREWFTKIKSGRILWIEIDSRLLFEKILIKRWKPLLNNKGSHVHFLAINEVRETPVEGALRYLEGI